MPLTQKCTVARKRHVRRKKIISEPEIVSLGRRKYLRPRDNISGPEIIFFSADVALTGHRTYVMYHCRLCILPVAASFGRGRNISGVGKIFDFRHLSRRISEMVQDMVQVAIDGDH